MSHETLPLVALPEVYRLGPCHAPYREPCASLEGHNLSVSVTPEAWQHIARLGGQPLWRLTNPIGRFIDVHAALDDESVMARVLGWASRAGLVERVPLYRAWFHYEEGSYYFECLTEAQARREMDGDPASELEVVPAWLGTSALVARTGATQAAQGDARDYALMAWVDVHCEQWALDGLWWWERLEPLELSAPRGAIVPAALANWSAHRIQARTVDDLEEIARVAPTRWLGRPAHDKAPSPGPGPGPG